MCIIMCIHSCFSELVFQVINTSSMCEEKWFFRASILKARGWRKIHQRLAAFLSDYEANPWEIGMRLRRGSESEVPVFAGSLWGCPVGPLTRHSLHKAHYKALATLSCISKEGPHFILTAHFP